MRISILENLPHTTPRPSNFTKLVRYKIKLNRKRHESMFRLRQRSCLLIITALVLTPCIIILMIMGPGLSTEQTLTQRLAECHMRLQYLETMYRARQEDVALLSQYLGLTQNQIQIQQQQQLQKQQQQQLEQQNQHEHIQKQKHQKHQQQQQQPLSNTTTITTNFIGNSLTLQPTFVNNNNNIINNNNNNTSNNSINYNNNNNSNNNNSIIFNNASGLLLEALSPETRQLLRDITHSQTTHRLLSAASSASIRLPTTYHFLPHLLDDPNSLRPAYIQSKGRSDASIVLGVPTVRREKQSYLLGTLKNLIENMNEEEQNETLIIVFIGETDAEAVHLVAKELQVVLEQYIEAGLIDIIAPSPSYYPNFDKLHATLNDSLERVKWRSKQNLDFAYLMAYAQTKGTFYVQLEDDILAKRNFITLMKKFAITKSALTKPDQPSWLILDFCQLGFIGKMFKSAELPYLITFFQMFYNDKPVDWLLVSFLESKVCRTDKDQKHCNLEKAKHWLHYRPSLFQHIGTSSSLKGKVQKLKDKQFRWKVPAYYAHPYNPPAMVKTNIAAYKNFMLKRAYNGETYFWGLLPQPGDLVQFIFDQPIQLRRYLFRSGNSEHPSDRFYNTTVEVLPADSLSENSPVWSMYNSTTDGYLVVGTFDSMGMAEGVLDSKIGAIKELRLHVHGDSENWVLLSEIDLQTNEAAAAAAISSAKSMAAIGNGNGNGNFGLGDENGIMSIPAAGMTVGGARSRIGPGS